MAKENQTDTLESGAIDENQASGISRQYPRPEDPTAVITRDAQEEVNSGEVDSPDFDRVNNSPDFLDRHKGIPHKGDETEVIFLKTNVKCKIGPQWYSFKKGKKYKVPSNVKQVLLRGDKLGVG